MAWVARERAAIAGGVDPRAGKQRVRTLLPLWLEERRASVSPRTYAADREVLRLLPPAVAALNVSAVTDREIQRALIRLGERGLAEGSIARFRASLSSFFAWCIRERLILVNPVSPTRVPRQTRPPVEMYPFTEQELEDVVGAVASYDQTLARVVMVAGWTGLRWSELRAMRVRDFIEVPMPLLVVERAAPERVAVKQTKGRRSRRVPVADRVLPLVREFAAAKQPDDLLFTTRGGACLHAAAVKRAMHWSKTGRGRRIHDLRHTAACLWLAKGVDPGTVQAWMGHSSIATTNIYVRHLGTGADRAGLERLNTPGGAGGARKRKGRKSKHRRDAG
jgi:integrase